MVGDGQRSNKLASTFVGAGLVVVALLLTIPITPMLLFARDSRDLTGGIAGGVLVLLMGLAGIVLVFREKTPFRLMRAFYFAFGVCSLSAGFGTIGFAVYEMTQGTSTQINRGMLSIPLLFIILGAGWIWQGIKLKHRDVESQSDPAGRPRGPE